MKKLGIYILFTWLSLVYAQNFINEAENFWNTLHGNLKRIEKEAVREYEKTKPALHQFESAMGNAFNYFLRPIFPSGLHSFRDKWEGPHVCVSNTVMEDDKKNISNSEIFFLTNLHMTSCKELKNSRECKTTQNVNGHQKTSIVKHECCHGYRLSDEGFCIESHLKSLEDTLSDLGLSEFSDILKQMNVDLSGNLTLFAPKKDVLKDLTRNIESLNSVDDENSLETQVSKTRFDSSFKDIVNSHILDDIIDSSDISDESLMKTRAYSVRNNIYSHNLWNVQCSRIVSPDNFASNGVIHVIDSIIHPSNKTISELLKSDIQFKSFVKALNQTNLLTQLNSTENTFTVFAPTEEAFSKLESYLQRRISEKCQCSTEILKNHIFPHILCSSVIKAYNSSSKSLNLLHKYIEFNVNEKESFKVEGVEVLVSDVMGTNGVIHVIDEVLLPKSAKSVPELLNKSKFMELFEEAGLKDFFNNEDNVTLFLPSDKSLKAIPESYLEELKENKEKLKNFLLYHITSSKVYFPLSSSFTQVSSLREDQNLMLNSYSTFESSLFAGYRQSKISTVQCATLVKSPVETCGGNIYEINKVLFPPSKTLLDFLKSEEDYSEFYRLLQLSDGLNVTDSTVVTLFVPHNDAFKALDPSILDTIKQNETFWASQIVKNHIISSHVCCSGITNFISKEKSLHGDILSLRRSVRNHVYVNNAEIKTCDLLNKNGVVQEVDAVLLPSSLVKSSSSPSLSSSTNNQLLMLRELFSPYKLF